MAKRLQLLLPFPLAAVALVAVIMILRPQGDSASGQQLYQQYCASCHGQQGEGQPNWQVPKPDGTYPAPPHDWTGHTWHHSDAVLIKIILEGGASVAPQGYKSGMPAFKGQLTEAEARAILAYIKGWWKPEQRSYQSQLR
jgi:mono/diheme cytochrome c family protein